MPVTAKGLRYASASGRSPMPLPNRRAGLNTSNDSAPAFFRPVPPAFQPKAAERMVSWAGLVKNWYLSVISRLPNPLSVLSFGAGSRLFHSPASVRPRLGKMRFENSPEMFAVLLDGASPSLGVLNSRKVGSESSSDTNGSSIVSVDGK